MLKILENRKSYLEVINDTNKMFDNSPTNNVDLKPLKEKMEALLNLNIKYSEIIDDIKKDIKQKEKIYKRSQNGSKNR